MRKHAETLHANKVCKLAIVVFIPTLWYTFQTLFALKQGLAHLYFLYENELLKNCLSYDLGKMATLLVLEVRFFQQVRFLGGLFFISSRVRVRVRDRFLDDTFFNEETPIYANEGINFGKSLSICIFNVTSPCIFFFIDNFSCYLFGTSQNTLKKCNCNFRSLPAQMAVWIEN